MLNWILSYLDQSMYFLNLMWFSLFCVVLSILLICSQFEVEMHKTEVEARQIEFELPDPIGSFPISNDMEDCETQF